MTKQWCRICFFICLLTSSFCSAQDPTPPSTTEVVLPPIEISAEKTGSFFPRVLELALQKTVPTHGPFRITHYPHQLTNGRFLAELERNGVINLMWTMTDRNREAELIPVKISLLKELNSYRIFLIRKHDQARFNKIKSLQELRMFRAGQGNSWPDSEVLKKNQLPLITSAHYELLFDMLEAGRFDYFPRGLYEIWDEYLLHKAHDISIEQTLMLNYHAPIYFFTSKQNIELANRIEQGLKIAIEDGSFDRLFYSYESFRRGEAELSANKRTVFYLQNN